MTQGLFVIKNGKAVDLSLDSIFDVKYTHLLALTYSVDEGFLSQHMGHFEDVKLVVGIQDYFVQERAVTGMSASVRQALNYTISNELFENVNFFDSLSNENKLRLQDRSVEIKVPIGFSIHSKLYLLYNETECRIIIGSANLSNNAFRFSHQHEIIHVIDDNWDLFRLHEDYFNGLYERCTDFVTKSIIDSFADKRATVEKRVREKSNIVIGLDDMSGTSGDGGSSTEDMVVRFTTKEKSDLRVDNQAELMDALASHLSDDELVELNEIGTKQRILSTEKKDESKLVSNAVELIKFKVKLTKGDVKVVSDARYKQAIRSKFKVVEADVEIDGLPEREQLMSIPLQRSDVSSGLYLTTKDANVVEQSFGRYATIDEIKRSMQLIVSLMSNYKNYVIDYDDAYGSRILEAILCGFTSPFISEIRTFITSDSGRLDFPTFMFLGGRAGSGKSNLLECISIMMGLKLDGKYLSYNSIIPKGVHNSKSILMKQLGNWLIEDNVAPLLIDEIDKDFFSNEQRGNELIVNTSNYTASGRHLSPCLIGTTNVEDYSLPERAQRRSYYIRFDKAFDRSLRKESNVAFEFVKNQLDDVLFQDFVMRFSAKLYNAEDVDFVQRFYSETGLVDFLHYSREIFKEYFDIAGIEIPEWFPMTRHDDLAESNKELWRLLYLHDKELFKQNGDDYVFNLNELNKNQTGKYGQAMKSVTYKDALDPKVSKSVGVGDIVVLKVDAFHDWIGVAQDGAELDLSGNRNWLQRLFGGK